MNALDAAVNDRAPSTWPRRRLRYLVDVIGGGTPSKDNPDYWGGDVPWVSPKDMKSQEISTTQDTITPLALLESATRIVPSRCVLVVVRSGILQRTIPVAMNVVPVALNQDMKALRCTGIEAEFLQFLISGLERRLLHQWRKVGATVESIEMPLLLNSVIAVPPPALQDAIIHHLRLETERMDGIIQTQERLVECVDERFAMVQQQRFIGKPTGSTVPGIHQGHLSSGWRAVPFRWLFREVDQRSVTGDEPLLSVSQTRGVILQSELVGRGQQAETYIGYKVCRPGDLIVNRMWVYYGALGVARQSGLVSPDYSIFRAVSPDVDPDLVAAVLKTPAFVAEMTMRVKGIGSAFQGSVRKPRLHPRELGEIVIPVPSPTDFDAIGRHLAEERRTRDQAVSAGMRFVDLLRERRSALITAAVNGQIDKDLEAA